jgi:hypothetical protein
MGQINGLAKTRKMRFSTFQTKVENQFNQAVRTMAGVYSASSAGLGDGWVDIG